MKTKLNLSRLAICLSVAFFIASCEKDGSCEKEEKVNKETNSSLNVADPSASSPSSSANRATPTRNRMTICHYDNTTLGWSVITIRNNQLGDHLAHGDVRIDDPDGDGYTATNPCGYVGRLGTGDCNDGINWIYPGAPEICNSDFDENCNGDDDDFCPN